jgi:hypothetical protein
VDGVPGSDLVTSFYVSERVRISRIRLSRVARRRFPRGRCEIEIGASSSNGDKGSSQGESRLEISDARPMALPGMNFVRAENGRGEKKAATDRCCLPA